MESDVDHQAFGRPDDDPFPVISKFHVLHSTGHQVRRSSEGRKEPSIGEFRSLWVEPPPEVLREVQVFKKIPYQLQVSGLRPGRMAVDVNSGDLEDGRRPRYHTNSYRLLAEATRINEKAVWQGYPKCAGRHTGGPPAVTL